MNKKFEQEYREMMEANVPDLWDRIEKGVNESERANSVIEFSASRNHRESSSDRSVRKKFKYNIYQLGTLAGVAACLVLLMIGVPAVRQSMKLEKEAEEMGSSAKVEQEAIVINEMSDDVEVNFTENDSERIIKAKEAQAEGSERSSEQKESEVNQKPIEPKEGNANTGNVPSAENQQEAVVAVSEGKTEDIGVNTGDNEKSSNSEADDKSSQNKKNKDSESVQAPLYKEDGVVAGSDNVPAGKADVEATKASSSSQKAMASSSSQKVTTSSSQKVTASSSQKVTASNSQKKNSSSAKQKKASSSEKKNKQSSNKRKSSEKSSSRSVDAGGSRTTTPVEMNVPEAEVTEKPEPVVTPVTYSGVQIKVTSVKKKDDGFLYTVKIVDDVTGNFKKNTKLIMSASKEMKKKSNYIVAFSDDGTKNSDNKTVYSIIDIEEVITEGEN